MSSKDRLSILFELGEVAHGEAWPDYRTYGFSETDVPALIGLVADQSLHDADVDSNDVWVPLHAWRVLGQLGSVESVEPLLQLLDGTLLEDGWAREELPAVIAMSGVAALGQLSLYLSDSAHSEYGRVVVAEALKSIVDRDSQSRSQVLDVFAAYLVTPDNAAPELNGLLVCCLIDLKARELIDAIETLYASGCVDVTCAGEFDEVKRALLSGAEAGRGCSPSVLATQESGQNLYDEINHYLMTYSRPTAVANVSELDGFFAALGCAPETIDGEDWLPVIWGGAEYVPQWESKEDEHQFISAVLVAYNRVLKSLNTDTFAALYHEPGRDGATSVADDWCQGFLRGINMWGPLPKSDAVFLERSLRPVRLFATEKGRQDLARMSAEEITSSQSDVEEGVRQMYLHWLKPRDASNTPAMAAPKIGRNEPCPCGSGKKFKKCCLH